jgi:hypothetical protein
MEEVRMDCVCSWDRDTLNTCRALVGKPVGVYLFENPNLQQDNIKLDAREQNFDPVCTGFIYVELWDSVSTLQNFVSQIVREGGIFICVQVRFLISLPVSVANLKAK